VHGPVTAAVTRVRRARARARLGPDAAECPICGTVAATFEPHGAKDEPDRRCPTCDSVERHRLMWLYFKERTNLFRARVRMLHLAPEPVLQERLRSRRNIDNLSADLVSSAAMVKMDITAIDLPDDQFDVIYASHVLEHIPEDRTAMRELHRVLRPGGWAVLQVPIWGPRTREEPIADPAERAKAYGLPDHVRMYGHDGVYEQRLREAGFDVTVDPFVRELDPVLSRRYRLMLHEDVYFCTKG
jgi:SAM-dependent methyltransferase